MDDKTTVVSKAIAVPVIVNNDPSSSQYRVGTFSICKNRKQVLVPPKFGTSYLVMSDIAVFHYKQSSYYHQQKQFTIKWNDPKFGIWWPISNPITSYRDSCT
jgi:dTDP-4-dehydrorhamnose 3,5-epimerase